MGYIYKFLTKVRFSIHKGSRQVDFVRELHLLQKRIKMDFSLILGDRKSPLWSRSSFPRATDCNDDWSLHQDLCPVQSPYNFKPYLNTYGTWHGDNTILSEKDDRLHYLRLHMKQAYTYTKPIWNGH